ncbi:hypothetical protein M758_10G004800 [Ceratodon purpureus]|nr:hypothetical protein M758_10G004800 [Ceratodon purpureus]
MLLESPNRFIHQRKGRDFIDQGCHRSQVDRNVLLQKFHRNVLTCMKYQCSRHFQTGLPNRLEDDQESTNPIQVAELMKLEDEIYKLNITCRLPNISLFQVHISY